MRTQDFVNVAAAAGKTVVLAPPRFLWIQEVLAKKKVCCCAIIRGARVLASAVAVAQNLSSCDAFHYGGVVGGARNLADWISALAPRGLCDELDSWSLPVHAEDSLRDEVAALQHEALMQFEDKHELRLQQKARACTVSLLLSC